MIHVEVVGDGAGSLDVSWDLHGDGPVEVAIGSSPQTIDHEHPVARIDGASRTSLRDVGRGRHYISVAPIGGGSAVVAAERLVPLEGGTNFRDLGGYRTAGGGRVRWGLVFRSAGLHRLTADDLATLDWLGLRVVYDLRTDDERDAAPSILPDGVRCEVLPIGGTAADTKELGELFVAGRLADVPTDFLVRIYEDMAQATAPTFGHLLTSLTEPDGLPALFHCTAGKDRTGMVAALLLSVLRVDESTIVHDYALSATYYTERQLEKLDRRLADAGIDAEHYHTVFGAPEHAMTTLLTTLRERHGSIDRYLVDQGGVDPSVFTELRARLVEGPDGRD